MILDNFYVNQLPALVAQVGDPQFLAGVIGATNRTIAHVDVCALFRYDTDTRPASFGAASVGLEEATRLTAERYVCGLGLYDPMRPQLNRLRPGEAPVTFRLQAEQIDNPHYRELNYTRTNTVERLSILFRDEVSCYSVNFYRKQASGVFASSERQALNHIAPLVANLTLKHIALSGMAQVVVPDPPAVRIERRIKDRTPTLSERECQVCTWIVLGHSSESIALRLGVSLNTVLTYRKRAYAKLAIGSQNELFRICLD